MTTRRHKIHWPQLNRTIDVEDGGTILEAAIENDIPIEHVCGGYCACTTCHIEVRHGISNLSPLEEEEKERLTGKGTSSGLSRLACQSKVYGDVTIEIP